MNVVSWFRVPVFLISLFISSLVFAETVWIDVRSQAEHTANNIPGDLRIDHLNIVNELASMETDKNADIRLYCRSGNRAGVSKRALEAAGYTSVTNVGSIAQARKERGLK